MKPFDEHLFSLKIQELSDRMHRETATRLHQADAEQKAIGQGRGTGWLVKRVDAAMGVFREFVPEIEKACRETWLSDHDSITPEFVRRVLVPHVFSIVAARKGAIEGDLELLARRVGIGTGLTPVLHHLVHETNHLKSRLATQYEIEALELAKHADSTKAPEGPRGRAPRPVTMVNTSRGLWLDPASKPTEIPHDSPIYFPSDLWPQTNVILLEAQRKFPFQTQALELCKHITSEMTPLFCEAVKTGKMTASAVLLKGLGGMQDLLHSLLACNDGGPKSGLPSLSDEAYRLGEKVRQSDEWLALSKAVTDAHLAKSTEGDRLRTGANQAESSPTPNENLRSSIFSKKARTTEIERTLNRPLATEHRGRAVHGGESWRLRLEEEKQHLLSAVEELEAEMERSSASRAQNSSKTAEGAEGKPATAAAGNTREAFLRPILEKKGLSVNDWATQAGVDFHTANDYLNGNTNPYQSTLIKLAGPLGIEVRDMPA